ncbi:alkaline phosphatase D family protein [Halobacillus salinarum]|uniref:Alkaline phosphatase D family protein n=1 Tax=Halobacillus salinarum TaxID=2932257 RepID=A0ABY4EQK0_9BACI|nr:alkaline phosphatase D family protein [Halobacillus salinarum]UOQ45947.1 alkaline phosphatase D family protein [Halobacillus salinarum]
MVLGAKMETFSQAFLDGSAYITTESLHDSMENYEVAVFNYEGDHALGFGFPQSVVSGDPTSSGMVLWTRVNPDLERGLTNKEIDPWFQKRMMKETDLANAIPQGGFVMFQISRDVDFSWIELSGFSPIWKDHDHVVKLDLDHELKPGKSYYYRFITKNGRISKTGHCKTLPKEEEDYPAARIGYISCQDYTSGYFNALSHLADENLDFFLHLGDYIYEAVGKAEYQSSLKERQLELPDGINKASSLEDYRTLYQTYRTDKDLQRLHESHAMAATWDDHEYANDAYSPGVAPDDSLKPDFNRRENADRAWIEYMPVRLAYETDTSIKLYRRFKLGKLTEVFMTDERSNRDAHPCGEKELDRYFTSGCEDIHAQDRSMLGTSQKEWLINGIINSSSKWTIWANQVQIAQMKLLGRYLNLDAWDGFAYERHQIARSVCEEGIYNFIALTGDFHSFEASYLKEEYTRESKPFGVELMVGSVTSSNLNDLVQKNLDEITDFSSPLPKNAAIEMAGQFKANLQSESIIPTRFLFKELQNLIKLENPWIELFDSTNHGYAVLELTRTNAKWSAFKVDSIEEPNAEKKLLFECDIPSGEVKINVKEKNSIFG